MYSLKTKSLCSCITVLLSRFAFTYNVHKIWNPRAQKYQVRQTNVNNYGIVNKNFIECIIIYAGSVLIGHPVAVDRDNASITGYNDP